MILSLMELRNFRKHINTNLRFSEGLNYIVGGNGIGKTTVLEAIYLMCSTKSFYAKDFEMLNFNASEFEVKGLFKGITTDKVRVYYRSADLKKYYFLNDKIITRSSDVIGKFPVVTLTPDDHSITQGAPSDRRRFVDSVISQASKTYLNFLIDYNKTLKHRAVVLTKLSERIIPSLLDELDAWTENLINNGTEIILHRKNFIKRFNEYLKQSYFKIMGNDELPEIRYQTIGIEDEENIKGRLTDLITQNRENEIRRGANLIGPHRDDFIFEINGINLKTFGSQGQNKTFQTVLRFAEFFYLKDITGNTPIFLLDDVFGELDAFRASKVSEYLKEVGQAFITLTDFANFKYLSKTETDLVIKLQDGGTVYV
ncbi:DNA replication/repair protein RecF [Ignavibacterium album]|uniref:DNA replication/repair protein RecF n=1 Tax=Ignavibacterium album TaxID=591197 RepID=UPI0035B7E22A